MLNKLVLVVLDGLCFDTAKSSMGFLNHLVEKNIGTLNKVKSELPSMSRPLYETILTGVYPYKSGITNNQICRLSNYKSLFHLIKDNGGISCASAYHWISELYNKAPFDYLYDCCQEDLDKPIQYGKFYFDDNYPDSHTIIDGEILRKKYSPNFLYIHPMSIDNIGHKFGKDSKEYRNKVIEVDVILSNVISMWLDEGYEVIVTSDHGMNEDGNHGGISDDERIVPLFYFRKNMPSNMPKVEENIKIKIKEKINIPNGEIIDQVQMAPIICKILGIEKSQYMETCKY